MTIGGLVRAGGYGNISLSALDSTLGNMTINAQVSSTTGNITITYGNMLYRNAPITTSGNITIRKQ